jgi:hypothetical protein
MRTISLLATISTVSDCCDVRMVTTVRLRGCQKRQSRQLFVHAIALRWSKSPHRLEACCNWLRWREKVAYKFCVPEKWEVVRTYPNIVQLPIDPVLATSCCICLLLRCARLLPCTILEYPTVCFSFGNQYRPASTLCLAHGKYRLLGLLVW